MSEPRIVLYLQRAGRRVFGWCEHLDEALRGTGVLAKSGGFILASRYSPDLLNLFCFVWGTSKLHDDRPFGHKYKSEREAQQAYDAICDCVRQVNASGVKRPDTIGGFARVV